MHGKSHTSNVAKFLITLVFLPRQHSFAKQATLSVAKHLLLLDGRDVLLVRHGDILCFGGFFAMRCLCLGHLRVSSAGRLLLPSGTEIERLWGKPRARLTLIRKLVLGSRQRRNSAVT